jgi:1L-myo-inositol 1-phosphate cytidylyltransferase
MANGVSVLRAAGKIATPFFLLMCDHLFDPDIVREMAVQKCGSGVILAVDRRIGANPLVDLEDVTRVWEEDGQIIEIGKLLPRYNAFDTGIFLCGAGLFEALESARSAGKDSLSDGVRELARNGAARVFDIGDRFWLDVDDERACALARKILGSGI